MVEQQIGVTFKVTEKEFSVQLKTFNTDCSIQVQKVGEGKPAPKDAVSILDNMTVAQYFAHNILVPLVKNIHERKSEINEHWGKKYKIMMNQLKKRPL